MSDYSEWTIPELYILEPSTLKWMLRNCVIESNLNEKVLVFGDFLSKAWFPCSAESSIRGECSMQFKSKLIVGRLCFFIENAAEKWNLAFNATPKKPVYYIQ